MPAEPSPDPAALRQALLAVSVLDDVDLEPGDDGVVLGRTGDPWLLRVHVGRAELVEALAGARPGTTTARLRLRGWLRLRRCTAELGGLAPDVLRGCARLLALPPGHALHPGPGWVRAPLLGGALDLGVGIVGGLVDGGRGPGGCDPQGSESSDATGTAPSGLAVPLPPGVARAAGVDVRRWWPQLTRHAEEMSRLAAERCRTGRPATSGGRRGEPGVLAPVGGLDVLSLLAGRTLRRCLAEGDGTGMRTLAVPRRDRGWVDLSRIDPAFVVAAAAATDPQLQGVGRPLLVTADEVVVAEARGDVVRPALADPVR